MRATDTPKPKVGDLLEEQMVTDTRVYEVVGVTKSTIRVRACRRGETVKKENRGGNPWPCVWTEALPHEGAEVRTVRLRADGTYRVNSYSALRPVAVVEGKPCFYTDYRE